jgi:hypothetical protein
LLLDIKNFFLNKYNLALLFLTASVSAYCLFIGRPTKEILNLFAVALFCLVMVIHPFINKKDMYAGATPLRYKGDIFNKWLRLGMFVFSVWLYIATLYKMVTGFTWYA